MQKAIAFFVLSCCIFAQTPDTAAIQGRVTDQNHGVVGGAHIQARNRQTGLERMVLTDASGAFSIAGLPVTGAYEVTASKSGFADARIDGVTLAGGSTATVTLEMAVAGSQTTVVVTGVAGEVRTDAPQVNTSLLGEQIRDLPLLSRRLTNAPLLNAANRPAISQGDVFINQTLFTTNGAGRRQAWFETDGASNSDSWGRQTMFGTLPVTAVEEMNVLANAFSAEYGASVGGVVNIVTRTGGDKLHGEVLELWRPNATAAALSGFTAANATSGNQWTSDSLGQSAASLGGPLGAATHFFAAGEYSREDKGSPVTSPLAPGIFVGHYRGWLGFARLDHQINEKNNVFFRGNLDGFHDTNPNGAVGGNSLPSVDRVFRRRTYSMQLGETAVLSPSMINNARVQFQLASPITQFDPVIYGTQYQVPISAGGTFTTGTSQSALLLNRQYQVNDTVSGSWGRHQVRAGFDVIHAHNGGDSKEFGGPIYMGQFVYNPCTGTLSYCESQAYLGDIKNVRSYTQSYGNASYTVDDTLWALFVQDDIRARADLTLNLGLRYERQTFTDAARDFGPRVGFSWNVKGDNKTVVRGGFGTYYSQIPDNAAANWALTGPTGVFNYSATPGQVGFPASVAAAPLPAFPAGAVTPLRTLYVRPGQAAYLNQFFPASTLIGYQNALLNPRANQWNIGIQRRVAQAWVLSVDYVGSHTSRINRPRDVNPPVPFIRTAPGQTRSAQAANCTRPYWIQWYAGHNMTCNPAAATNPQPPYSVITSDVNDGYATYHALDVNLSRRFSRKLTMLASYTWSHTLDNVDPDVPGQTPNDPNFTGRVEYGNAIFDQRHRFVLSGVYVLPGQVHFGGVMTLASGLPYNIVTGANNSGDTGATTDRPVINGVVVGRNTGRGAAIYDVAPFLERAFAFAGERLNVVARVEAFNVFNHANFVGYSGTWGNGATAGAGFGTPLSGVTAQLPARSMQFSVKLAF
ncbi:MAG: TonB-dependent receptor [Acidobacteria bacterium]|nr:TonB-dependent receptor [Acidobacteriota bacterium]